MDTEEFEINSDDDQLTANNNPVPTEHAAGRASESRIIALNSNLSPPQAVTSLTEEVHNINQVEAPNSTPWENSRQQELHDEHASREGPNPMYVAIVGQPPIEESGDEHDERYLIVSIMPL